MEKRAVAKMTDQFESGLKTAATTDALSSPQSPRSLRTRVLALLALAVFVLITYGAAPFVAGSFPKADLSEALGNESVVPGVLGAIELYAVLCATALIPAFACSLWLWRLDRPLATLGFAGRPQVKAWLMGALAGCGLIGLLCTLLASAGWYRVTVSGPDPVVLLVLLGLVLAALYEELLFRGFGFWAMEIAAGPAVAIALSSVLFAIAHADNSGAHWLGMVNTALAGALLGVLRWRSNSLWMAWGVHLGWNVALGLLFGARTSGFAFAGRLMESAVSASGGRHFALTGGAYGPEGSVLLTPMLIVWIVWLIRQPRSATEPQT